MPDFTLCNICDEPSTFEASRDKRKIHSNIERFLDQEFTVWRCNNCGSLHCLEDIDYDEYYRDYPLQSQELDFIARRFYFKRLRQSRQAILTKNDMILDYGCGNGAFVHFLREQGYINAFGYDPYSKHFTDKAVLEKKYDAVLSQDVIEHVTDPKSYLHELSQYVKQDGGRLMIGTPDAAKVHLTDPLDVVGRLHQPHHRHLISGVQLSRLIERAGFQVIETFDRFYVDTCWPFLNSNFLYEYDLALGGAFDHGFRPIQYRVILKSPKLWLSGLLGRWLSKPQDIVVVARRKKANVST